MLPVEDLLALALDRLDCRWGAALDQTGRPVLEVLLHGGQLAQRVSQVVLYGRPLTLKEVLVVGQDQGALPTIDYLLGAPALGSLQAGLNEAATRRRGRGWCGFALRRLAV